MLKGKALAFIAISLVFFLLIENSAQALFAIKILEFWVTKWGE